MDYYKDEVLDEEVHSQLVDDINGIANRAGIPKKYIYQKFKLSKREMKWFKRTRQHKASLIGGALYTSKYDNIHHRMKIVAGILLRNFIDCRVLTLQELLDEAEAGLVPANTVLLIPDFYTKTSGLPKWKQSTIHSILLKRLGMNQLNVLYVHSFNGLQEQYGSDVYEILTTEYNGL